MKKVLLFAAIIISAISCQKEFSGFEDTPQIGIPKLPATPVTGSVAGQVVDETNTPVANAQVNIGTTMVSTDNDGFFNTANLTLDKYITTVKVTVPGYHTAYRAFSANPTKNYVSIKLIPKDLAGTFASGSTGSIALSNGSAINFQANSIKEKVSGAAYTGTVNVYATYIDPTAADFGATVPGSLMAEDAVNFYTLRSTGMMAVELESPSGVALQLVENKPATMKMTIPSSLLTKAPAEIDTWSLDSRGVWIKEGVATRNGNAYDFQVSHFSFWNCDVPMNAIYLSMNVKDNNGINQVNKYVTLTSSTTWGSTGSMTDSLGNASGMVPKNETLEFRIYSSLYNCNSPFYTTNIGPFGSNSNVNIVATLPTTSNSYTITGTVNNCTGSPVANGSVRVFGGYNNIYQNFTNGTFSVTLTSCVPLTTVNVIATDFATQQQGATTTAIFTGSTANAGLLTACGTSIDEFITYVIDGTSYSITSNNTASSLMVMGSSTTTFVSAYNQVNNTRLSFGTTGSGPGTFPVTNDSLLINNFIGAFPQPGATATFTAYGTPGQFVEGTFSLPFTASGASHTMTGSFRIRRM